MSRVDEIGKQPQLEVFRSCVSLHGDLIRMVHKTDPTVFHEVCEHIEDYIENHPIKIKDYQVSDYKIALNGAVKIGVSLTLASDSKRENDLNKIFDNAQQLVKEKEADKKKKEEEEKDKMKVCISCGQEKDLRLFTPKRGHVGHQDTCTKCVTDKQQRTKAKKRAEEEAAKQKELDLLKEKNEKLTRQLEECGQLKEEQNYKKDIINAEDLGAGLYFFAAILKTRTGKLFHATDQIYGISTAEAVGKFTLSICKDHTIISIGYEKARAHEEAIHNTDAGYTGS